MQRHGPDSRPTSPDLRNQGRSASYESRRAGSAGRLSNTSLRPVVPALRKFRSFLMYSPERGRNSIFVPLQVIAWSWSADLENTGGWKLIDHGGNEDDNLTGQDTTEFPVFSETVRLFRELRGYRPV